MEMEDYILLFIKAWTPLLVCIAFIAWAVIKTWNK
jgi:hypothetical protein